MPLGHKAQLAADHLLAEISAADHGQPREEIQTGHQGHQEEPGPQEDEDLFVEDVQRQDAQVVHNTGRSTGPELEHLALGDLGEDT